MVAGLERPDSGRVLINGRDMTRVPPQDRDVAMVFQGFALYPHMKVKDILAFPLKMRRVAEAERRRLVAETAEMLAISRLLERRPAELSGGEQQRVAMGRAIVRRPAAFLFDEPLSNLDAALRAELRVELGKLLRNVEATALYVTHDQAEAMTLGRRIAVLRAGTLEQLAAPREIYERPASAFVAGFFGNPPMNLLRPARRADSLAIGDSQIAAPADGELLLGIRPEHVRIDTTSSAASDDELHARAIVTSREPHGAETHVELDLDGQPLRARVAGFDAPEPGSQVRVVLSRRELRWFDAVTGRAL
jgi:multiple sugar transport system ATP-binding protein